MRRILLPTLLVLVASRARAEDFTGFYAGFNAGFATGRERDRAAVAPAGAGDRGGSRIGPDVPPSVVDATAALRRPGRSRLDVKPGR